MSEKVVLIVICGRKDNLEILIPYIVAAKEHFDYCELWMNPCWSEEDEQYIRKLPKTYPGVFLLKDDGKWVISGQFNHYVRYYDTLAKDDTLYVKIDDDILWMAQDAIKNIILARQKTKWPMIVIGNIINNTFCNVKHQELGIYPRETILSASCYDKLGQYSAEFAEDAHRKFIKTIRANIRPEDYNFQDCTAPVGTRVPNHVFAFYGKDILWKADDEAEIGITLTLREGRAIYIAGNALFSHYAYNPQIEGMDKTNIRGLYKEFHP